MTQADPNDPDELAGRCRFCGAQIPPDAEVCPECGRDASAGYSFRLRRPLWVRVLIYVILLLFAGALLFWLADAATHWGGATNDTKPQPATSQEPAGGAP